MLVLESEYKNVGLAGSRGAVLSKYESNIISTLATDRPRQTM